MNHSKKVAFYTLGCKLNFSETSGIARTFEEAGYARVDFQDRPDIFIINTCSVTENADKKCKQLVKQAKKISPDAYVAIIGCYAQLKPEEISKIKGVNMVLGAAEKFNILEHIAKVDAERESKIVASEIKHVREFIPSYSIGDRTRTFLKVQDGCDYFCSFCTIPLARGRSRSNTIAQTLSVAKEVADTDVKEVVLTGVNIGDFGKGTEENFFGLVQELDKIKGIDRFRISSIEPNLLSNEIIDFVAKSRSFVPHFHIPLQSGSDNILKLMRRRYATDLYRNRIEQIKQLMPDACIGVDVIVGYPGETDEEFMKTVHFLKDINISYLHVFTYSERNNTTAVRSEDVIPMEIRKERSKQLHLLSDKKKRHFYEQQLGKPVTVLFETENHDGFMHGFTENYLKIKAPFNPHFVNQLKKVIPYKIEFDGLMLAEVQVEAIA
ncbi:tRNA (N(6)-L-threonylcarbamoyladenosine(37)-C(2))-methylthiotransferase MtaB [bacterium]|nr:tRNA (N(6)-L-threonylcarbamoyladenosine(37)-C(2))-methylthiotransferase MtaB [bacterium]